jgi:hypothetical protein
MIRHIKHAVQGSIWCRCCWGSASDCQVQCWVLSGPPTQWDVVNKGCSDDDIHTALISAQNRYNVATLLFTDPTGNCNSCLAVLPPAAAVTATAAAVATLATPLPPAAAVSWSQLLLLLLQSLSASFQQLLLSAGRSCQPGFQVPLLLSGIAI